MVLLYLQIIYLRRFKSLQTLNLNGNPICEQEDYKPYISAHMPSIEYLDYRLIDETAVSATIFCVIGNNQFLYTSYIPFNYSRSRL